MVRQLALEFPRPEGVRRAVDALAAAGQATERGAVFTKGGVVRAILDLCGYTSDRPLHTLRLLEPSFGQGDFLLEALDRLLRAFQAHGGSPAAAGELASCLCGVEVHGDTYERTRGRILARLRAFGVGADAARRLVDAWLVNDDFLLTDLVGAFDFVVGNPPYVRQERIPSALLKAYKDRFATLYDRADLYVPFYERGLDLLADRGTLGYICANRWIKNKYGGPLRQKVARGFHLKYYVDLERADAFHSEVIAYPAITVIQRGEGGPTRVALGGRESAARLSAVVEQLRRAAPQGDGGVDRVVSVHDVASGRDPWLLDAPHVLRTLREMESRLPTLEEAGARVGIGVATGADRVFIGPLEDLPVERERKLPLVMAGDCADGEVRWGGWGIVNPYDERGGLAPLSGFPRFAAYLASHEATLRRRHTARKHPAKWYKTIDRIDPTLTLRPKLLIPDIKGEAVVCLDPGHYYPHHNLYVVTSDIWDLRVLQAVLRSSAALAFVAAYGVRMSGGFLRFQAQYLRRIRVPPWASLSRAHREALRAVASRAPVEEVDAVVLPLYGLDGRAASAIRAFAQSARVRRKAA